ncbi:MAG TPA: hypothetical protein PKW49_12785 [Paludibacteraceae bacterium]|nr:hypothetical protein [Paludibacteraceae bacterium]HQF51153.1 hypothetical protein [Paludibacteraceae bacterium]
MFYIKALAELKAQAVKYHFASASLFWNFERNAVSETARIEDQNYYLRCCCCCFA